MPNDWHDWPLAICLVVNGLLAGVVVSLRFQLWLSRRCRRVRAAPRCPSTTAGLAPGRRFFASMPIYAAGAAGV